MKDTPFIAIVTKCARATLIYLFKSAQPVHHIRMEVLFGQDFFYTLFFVVFLVPRTVLGT